MSAVGERISLPIISKVLDLEAATSATPPEAVNPFVSDWFTAEGFLALIGFVRSDKFSETPAGTQVANIIVRQSLDTKQVDINQEFPVMDSDEVKTLAIPIQAKFIQVEIQNLVTDSSIVRTQLQLRRL